VDRLRNRLLEQLLRLGFISEQRLHLAKKTLVAGAGLLEKRETLGRRAPERRVVQLLDPREAAKRHHRTFRETGCATLEAHAHAGGGFAARPAGRS